MISRVDSTVGEPSLTSSQEQSVDDALRLAQLSIDGYGSSALLESPEGGNDDRTDLENLSAVLDLIGSLEQSAAAADGQEAAAVQVKIGRYEVLGEIGRGGFGIALHAFDALLEREVALKIPRPERLLAGQALDEMVREARVVAKLSHPGIVRVYEVRRLGPVWYIASDFCDGPTLAQWLSSQAGPVEPSQAARLLAEVADAIHYAHLRGVLHLDLKPANILLMASESGAPQPMVTDFGLAYVGVESPGAFRRIGGTLSYMAPEQKAQDAERISVATDVYALGVILSEMLSPLRRGESDEPDANASVEMAAGGTIAIPRDVRAIRDRCMADDPSSRYQSAHDLADDLLRFIRGWPVAARPLSPLEQGAYLCRRKPFATTAVVALLAIIFGSYALVVAAWRDAEAHLAARRISERQRQVATTRMEDSLLNLAWLAQEAKLRVPHVDDETGSVVPGVREFFKDVRPWAEAENESSTSTDELLAATSSLSLVDEIEERDDTASDETFREGLSAWLALTRRDPGAERWHRALAMHLFTYKLRQGDGRWLSWRSSTLCIDAPTRRKVELPYALLLIDYAAVRLRERDPAASYGMLVSALEILEDDASLFSQAPNRRLHWLITAHQQAAAAAARIPQREAADSHHAALSQIAESAPAPADCDARSAASIAEVLARQWRRSGQSESDDALSKLRRAASYGRRAIEAAPDNPSFVAAHALQHRYIAIVFDKRRQFEARLQSLREALSILNQAVENDFSNDRKLRIERARLAKLLGESHLLSHEPLVARQYFEQAAKDFDAVRLTHTDTRGTWLAAGSLLQSLAKLYESEKRVEECQATYRRSLDLMEALQRFRKHHRAEALIKQARHEIKTLNEGWQSAQAM